MGLKRESRFCVGNVGSGHFAHHFRSVGIEHREEARTGIQSQLHSRRSDDIESVLLRQSEVVYTPPRIVHKDLCRGLCLWVVGFSALVISKQTEDIVAVEVDREHLAVLMDPIVWLMVIMPAGTAAMAGTPATSGRANASAT